MLVAVFAGVVGAGSGTVWLAGVLAGVASGSGPIVLSGSEAARVLARLPTRLEQPAQAWPESLRGDLPSTAVILAALGLSVVVVLACAAAVLWVVLRLIGRGGEGRGRSRQLQEPARWAKPRDLRPLVVAAPQQGRVVLGRLGRRLIAAEPRTSVLVVAPSQSGKTTGLAIPAILEWDGPVLATSVKGDLTHDTLRARTRIGDARIFDPTGSTGLPTRPWSPVSASGSWEGARRTAAGLLLISEHSVVGGSSDDRFWKPAAARYLAPLLLAAAHDDRPMSDVLDWVARGDGAEVELEALLGDLVEVEAADVALGALRSIWTADPRFQSSVLQTLATALDAWLEPSVGSATGSVGAIDAAWLLEGRNTLYLTAPAHDQQRLRGLFAALIGSVVSEAFRRATATGKPLDPPLLLCLDEAANVAPLPNLGELASTGPGQGVTLLTVLQNKAQADDRWGSHRAETIIANHGARVFGSGISDRATIDYLGAILGDEEVEKVATHKDRTELVELGSRTVSREYRRLGAPNRIRQADRDTALLVYRNLPPAWIALRPWYANDRLRALVEGTPQRGARASVAADAT